MTTRTPDATTEAGIHELEIDLAELELHEMNERKIEMSLAWFSEHPEEIEVRLDELDREWDLNRLIQVGAAGLTVGGVGLGFLFGKKWFLVPGIAGWVLWKYGLKNESPPAPFLRKLGIRTVGEIAAERQALLAILGNESLEDGDEGDEEAGEATDDTAGTGARKKKSARKGEPTEAAAKSGE